MLAHLDGNPNPIPKVQSYNKQTHIFEMIELTTHLTLPVIADLFYDDTDRKFVNIFDGYCLPNVSITEHNTDKCGKRISFFTERSCSSIICIE